ncbi:MAG: TrkH family potassium uptake protein [Phascolarctobacterium sp.]|nr:TrkH family potassium uptake protein [Phascolarctobacterium sp.]
MDLKLVFRLLGMLGMAFSLVILIPLIASFIIDQEHMIVFLGTLCISLVISGIFLFYGARKTKQRLRIREAFAVVGCGWLMVCILGSLPYLLNGTMDPITAIFESVSGFTTTGVTTSKSFQDFPVSILVWRCLTHWCGGIGVIMLFIIIMPQMNSGTGYLLNAEMPGSVIEHTLPRIKESAMLIFTIYVFLTAVEIILFIFGGVSVPQSINLALATMATGGFSYYNDSLISFNSVYVEIIAVVFMLISSINFSLYYKIWRSDWTAIMEDAEHKYYLSLLAIAACLITIDLYWSGYFSSIMQSARHGLFQAISISTTTGFASDDFNKWPSFSRFILLLLMFIGGCSGSTAGGIKIYRIIVLIKASWSELLRTLHPKIVYSIKIRNKPVEPEVVGSIMRFFFLYILVFMVLTILISLTGLSLMDSIGVIAACLSSVGPAFSIVGPTTTYGDISLFGRLISICAMLLGRLEIFTLLVIMRLAFWRNKQNW